MTAPVGEASSLDGRSFSARLDPVAPVVSGDLVVLALGDGRRLCGQVHEKQFDGADVVCGGSVIGALDGSGALTVHDPRPFTGVDVVEGDDALWATVADARGATMPIGTTHGAAAMLRPAGLNRHTFVCGQSGSGKSYSLGVVLEQVLIDTELDVVVLDPNADFVRLGEVLPDAAGADTERLSGVRVDVLRPHADGDDALRVRFTELSRTAMAAVLELDPLRDREEYNALLELSAAVTKAEVGSVVDDLMHSSDPAKARLAQRVENLGVLDWPVWARGSRALSERLDGRARVTVLDLSGFERPAERQLVALDLLDRLWAARESRRPVLLVVDEAHDVCRAEPVTDLERAVAGRLVQIAGEGRKYGLWMLLCTQRPSRVHPMVVSQCDNLMVLRMNSRADLAGLQETFGFVPPEMIAAAANFAQGEALVAGGFAPVPMHARVGRRRTHEGGLDVAVPMPSEG